MTMSNNNRILVIPSCNVQIVDSFEMSDKIRRLNNRTYGFIHRTTMRFAIEQGVDDQLVEATRLMMKRNGTVFLPIPGRPNTDQMRASSFALNPDDDEERKKYSYYLIIWARGRFSVRKTHIYYRSCRRCFNAILIGERCNICDKVSCDLYFVPRSIDVPWDHDYAEGPWIEITNPRSDPLELAKVTGHAARNHGDYDNVPVHFDLEHFAPKNEPAYAPKNMALWRHMDIDNIIQYLDWMGTQNTLTPDPVAHLMCIGATPGAILDSLVRCKDFFNPEIQDEIEVTLKF